MLDPNATTNGDAFMVSVDKAGKDAPTYICGVSTHIFILFHFIIYFNLIFF